MHLRRFTLPAGVLAFAVGMVVGAGPASAASCPWMNPGQSPASRTSELLGAMSLADKVQMVTGTGEFNPTSANPEAASTIAANPSLCIPALVLNDATNGVGDQQQLTTAFPDSIALASSWDPALAEQYGAALGAEAFAKGVNVLLGPGVDIARNPLNGRNFEYMGEDPYLAGQSAAAVIEGIQSQHVIATVKHYALNDQETDRTTDSSDASERTMQEIDLPAFDAAVKAGVGAVMCSYNRINSVYACQNPYTLRDVLDEQFGFTGFVMSDWGANHSTVASADAGLDMEMPGGVGTSPEYYGSSLQTAVQDGQVSMGTLNEMVSRILYSMFRIGLFDHVPTEGAQAAATPATTPTSIAMATKVAEEGTVLLKNAGGVLPLSGPGRTIAVIGPAAGQPGATLAEQGYGSGHVPEFSYQPGVVSPLQAITARAAQAGDIVTYADGDATDDAVAAAKAADAAIVFINDVEIEGADRPDLDAHAGTCSFLDFASSNSCTYTPLDENTLVSAVAAANPNTIVVIQSGDPIAMPWVDQVRGILENWYPGQVDGDAIAPVLFGDVDPSGRLPITFPVSLSDDPLQTAAQYPGVMEAGDSVGPHSTYSEGLLVGYRWYDAEGITPLFPFGYGLSYTSFRYSGVSVTRTASGAQVSFTVTNTGSRAGADVPQVYVGDPPAVGEPPEQLKGFRRVSLAPGQSETVTIALDPMSFAYWNTQSQTWTLSAGTYRVMVGSSSSDIAGQGSVALPGMNLGG
ncbi:MAG TPA: glycoside hydrolase family 3 C-terminal domain-containing protein [Solirubrobacteraceae bacterium]|nr:glycoside hydrolase family 3 C-terminal domain-containing protein [Solirubrobacteraceae bacterium]